MKNEGYETEAQDPMAQCQRIPGEIVDRLRTTYDTSKLEANLEDPMAQCQLMDIDPVIQDSVIRFEADCKRVFNTNPQKPSLLGRVCRAVSPYLGTIAQFGATLAIGGLLTYGLVSAYILQDDNDKANETSYVENLRTERAKNLNGQLDNFPLYGTGRR